MNLHKNISVLLSVLVAACSLLAGCTKDIDLVEPGRTAEGNDTELKFDIVFEPMVSTGMTTRATDAPDGDAINDIEDLCVLFFDTNKKLTGENGIREVKRENLTFVDAPAYETDRQATFTLDGVPYGTYYMYAVANLGKKKTTKTFTKVTSTYEILKGLYDNGELTSVDDLKAIQLTWDPEQISNNAEMLGYFSAGEIPGTPAALDNAPKVVIDRNRLTLHSWLRRAASKVTIEFDPSGLRNNIRIYIKSARLRHIPLHCPLGDKNEPGNPATDLIPDDSKPYYHIDYYPEPTAGNSTATDHEMWMVLAKGGILDGATNTPVTKYDGMHTADAKALYFYENMQGKGKSKLQDSNGDGELDYPGKNTSPDNPGYMDQKPCGTYVEIEGHYVSNAPGNYGQGTIIYRFMLGKNVTDDYDAERNHHYKLTLKFRGNANDVDWHIDYTPESDILYAPDPYYISYLYNQSMELPLYVSGKVQNGDHIDLKIVKNGWGPSDPAVLKEMYPYTLYGKAADPVCNGFLSLKESENASGVLLVPAGSGYTNDRFTEYNYFYWNDRKLGELSITDTELKADLAKDGAVNVTLYTREKQLVKTTAFTGNNIYPSSLREAILEVSGVIGGQAVPKKQIKILQMRRVINPSGVFRKSSNTEPFKITMAVRMSDRGQFMPLHSIGPWNAKIVGDGWEIVGDDDGNVSGDDGSEITLSVRPTSAISDSETKCAYVDISYNNLTCHHRVILRQGDVPLALIDGKSEWYYSNLRTRDKLVDTPVDEGSLFRYGNSGQPISSSNQTWASFGMDAGTLDIEGGQSSSWNNISIPKTEEEFKTGFSETAFLDGTATVATHEDFVDLFEAPNIDFKYGILYGDGATCTQMDTLKAYGYNRYHNPDAECGMRGVFVYNSIDGRSIFFPVGSTGHGRRKDNGPNENGHRGVLRYANRSPYNKWGEGLANYAPLFTNIHEYEGAIYWTEKVATVPVSMRDYSDEKEGNGWDINFRTLDFNTFGLNGARFDAKSASCQSDAAFIRCVVKK